MNTTAATNTTLAEQPPPMFPVNPFFVRERNLTLGLLGIVFNTFTLMAVVRHKELNRPLRAVLCSLITTDFGFCFNTIVITILTSLGNTAVSCKAAMCINIVFVDCTALTLVVIALDRLLAVYKATWYKFHMDSWVKAVLFVLVPWIAAVTLSVMSSASSRDSGPPCPFLDIMTPVGRFLQGGLFLLTSSAVLFMYMAVGIKLLSRRKLIVVFPSFVAAASGRLNISPPECRRIRRITIHTTVLAVWFLIVYLPLACILIIAFPVQADGGIGKNNIPLSWSMVVTTALMLNSLLNPVFFWRLFGIKSLLARICANMSTQRNSVDIELRHAVSVTTNRN